MCNSHRPIRIWCDKTLRRTIWHTPSPSLEWSLSASNEHKRFSATTSFLLYVWRLKRHSWSPLSLSISRFNRNKSSNYNSSHLSNYASPYSWPLVSSNSYSHRSYQRNGQFVKQYTIVTWTCQLALVLACICEDRKDMFIKPNLPSTQLSHVAHDVPVWSHHEIGKRAIKSSSYELK